MSFPTITVFAGGLSVGVTTYTNSAVLRSFANGDSIVRFTGGKTFNFPDPVRYKGRIIEFRNMQASQTVTINTPLTDAEAPVSIPAGGKIRCESDGDIWMLG